MQKFYKLGMLFSFIAVVSLAFGSCATIIKGSTDGVNFSSDPAGAKVYVNGTLLGTTPVQLELKSKSSYTIEFKKEGYETRTVLLNNSVGAGWIVLGVLFGLVPIIVDAATSDWYSLDQEHVNGVLEEQK